MTPEQVVLAKKLVSPPQWEWSHPMAAYVAAPGEGENWYRITEVYAREMWGVQITSKSKQLEGTSDVIVPKHAIPDLTDWATIGCLLGTLIQINPYFKNCPACEADFDSAGECTARMLLDAWEKMKTPECSLCEDKQWVTRGQMGGHGPSQDEFSCPECTKEGRAYVKLFRDIRDGKLDKVKDEDSS